MALNKTKVMAMRKKQEKINIKNGMTWNRTNKNLAISECGNRRQLQIRSKDK